MSSVTAYMEGLANSMTAAIRRKGDPGNSAPVVGSILVNRTCVRFDWRYLFFDAALLTGAMCLLATTLMKSRRIARGDGALDAGRGPWKSSSLPLLWCGLEDSTRKRHGALDYLKEMTPCSDLLEVKLVRAIDETPAEERTESTAEAEVEAEAEIGADAGAGAEAETESTVVGDVHSSHGTTTTSSRVHEEVHGRMENDLIADEEGRQGDGQVTRGGRWVLHPQQESSMTPKDSIFLRRWGAEVSKYLPI